MSMDTSPVSWLLQITTYVARTLSLPTGRFPVDVSTVQSLAFFCTLTVRVLSKIINPYGISTST